jgi:hypothetical protein
MVLVHDDDLERINGIGEGTVSDHVISDYHAFPHVGNPCRRSNQTC